MKTIEINLKERLVKITLVTRSAATFKNNCKRDFGIPPKNWRCKTIKKNENEYIILLKTTIETSGDRVRIDILGTRLVTALMELSRDFSEDKDTQRKVFKMSFQKLINDYLYNFIFSSQN